MKQDRPLHKGPYRNSKERYQYGREIPAATIGLAIRSARRAAGMTQAELAAKMYVGRSVYNTDGGITRSYVTQMETGKKPIYWSHWNELMRLLPDLTKLKTGVERGVVGLSLVSDNSGRPKKSRRSQ